MSGNSWHGFLFFVITALLIMVLPGIGSAQPHTGPMVPDSGSTPGEAKKPPSPKGFEARSADGADTRDEDAGLRQVIRDHWMYSIGLVLITGLLFAAITLIYDRFFPANPVNAANDKPAISEELDLFITALQDNKPIPQPGSPTTYAGRINTVINTRKMDDDNIRRELQRIEDLCEHVVSNLPQTDPEKKLRIDRMRQVENRSLIKICGGIYLIIQDIARILNVNVASERAKPDAPYSPGAENRSYGSDVSYGRSPAPPSTGESQPVTQPEPQLNDPADMVPSSVGDAIQPHPEPQLIDEYNTAIQGERSAQNTFRSRFRIAIASVENAQAILIEERKEDPVFKEDSTGSGEFWIAQSSVKEAEMVVTMWPKPDGRSRDRMSLAFDLTTNPTLTQPVKMISPARVTFDGSRWVLLEKGRAEIHV